MILAQQSAKSFLQLRPTVTRHQVQVLTHGRLRPDVGLTKDQDLGTAEKLVQSLLHLICGQPSILEQLARLPGQNAVQGLKKDLLRTAMRQRFETLQDSRTKTTVSSPRSWVQHHASTYCQAGRRLANDEPITSDQRSWLSQTQLHPILLPRVYQLITQQPCARHDLR
jgi:hypothetical protein